jgi:hypothetical protein
LGFLVELTEYEGVEAVARDLVIWKELLDVSALHTDRECSSREIGIVTSHSTPDGLDGGAIAREVLIAHQDSRFVE